MNIGMLNTKASSVAQEKKLGTEKSIGMIAVRAKLHGDI